MAIENRGVPRNRRAVSGKTANRADAAMAAAAGVCFRCRSGRGSSRSSVWGEASARDAAISTDPNRRAAENGEADLNRSGSPFRGR